MIPLSNAQTLNCVFQPNDVILALPDKKPWFRDGWMADMHYT